MLEPELTEMLDFAYMVLRGSFGIGLKGLFFLLIDRLQFVSLAASEISIECNILGNCYEAFAMYSFGRYLIACLGMLKMMVWTNALSASLSKCKDNRLFKACVSILIENLLLPKIKE